MESGNYQAQIDAINAKLDRILLYIEERERKQEEVDDLIKDAGIVAKDAFRNSVILLENAGVELDSGILSALAIKFLQNVGTVYELLEMMESARDFMKDVSPVLHQVGLDAVNKMNEFDRKGYFEYLRHLGRIADRWVQNFSAEEMERMEEGIGHLAGLLKKLSDPDLVAAFERATTFLAESKIDKHLDDKSLWQLFIEMRSPEVRQSLSYTIRLMKAINRSN